MNQKAMLPSEFMVLSNHIYEYKKGIRNLVLFTLNAKYESMACERLKNQNIDYVVQRVEDRNVNIYFGESCCLDVIRTFISRPVNQLSPEEDFMLGALLGYDICKQCTRFCKKKNQLNSAERNIA